MPDWLVWLIVAGIFAGAEATSLTFVLIMFSGGALAGSITAAAGGSLLLQFIVAIVATVALIGGVRPIAKKHLLNADSATITGSDALVGQEAIVLRQVDARDGRVRLNGAEWSARAYDQKQILPAGTVVRVMKIHGATAVVLHEDPYFKAKELP